MRWRGKFLIKNTLNNYYGIFLLLIVILLTYIASSGNLNADGSDILNPYRYYLTQYYGGGFYEFIKIYDGREYELLLPALTYIYANLIPFRLSINEYAFLLSVTNNILLFFGLKRILDLFLKKNSQHDNFIILFLFFILLDYGIIQQLIRQSLSISLFVMAIGIRIKYYKYILLLLSLIAHYSIIYIIIFYSLFNFRFKFLEQLGWYCLPLLAISLFEVFHPALVDHTNEFKINLRLFAVSIILLCYVTCLRKKDFIVISTLMYISAYILYYEINLNGLFQRLFLINSLIIIPLMASYVIQQYKIRKYVLLFATFCVVANISLKIMSNHYLYQAPFINQELL